MARLKTYFGRKNAIEMVRNKHAFHYDVEQFAQAYFHVPMSEEFAIFVGESDLNNYYAFADLIANVAMLESVLPGDPAGALERMRKEGVDVQGDLHAVIINLMYVAMSMHLGKSFDDLDTEDLTINPELHADEIRFPYFVRGAGADIANP